MRKGMEVGVIKQYVGNGQADKLGWTSVTTLETRDTHTYYNFCFPTLIL